MSTIDITDRAYKPDIDEISAFVGNPLFRDLHNFLSDEYKALYSIEYSGDTVLLGWNVKFHKSGRTLCRVYPRKEYFTVLVVVGRKEKDRVECMLSSMSEAMRNIYNSTAEGMGQRWLVFDVDTADGLYDDLKTLIAIRRESK